MTQCNMLRVVVHLGLYLPNLRPVKDRIIFNMFRNVKTYCIFTMTVYGFLTGLWSFNVYDLSSH